MKTKAAASRKVIGTIILLSIGAAAQQPAPLPQATIEQKKEIIRQRLAAAQAAQARPQSAILTPANNAAEANLLTTTYRPDGPPSRLSADYSQRVRELENAASIAAKRERVRLAGRTAPFRDIRDIETDQAANVGKPFRLVGLIDVSEYYTGPYSEAQARYLSFELTDQKGNRANLYLWRPEAGTLREKILQTGSPIQIECSAVIYPELWDGSAKINAELLEARLPKEK